MKNLFLLPVIAILFLTSCTTEENYTINEPLIDGAYYNETRIDNQVTEFQEGITTSAGIIHFDAQEIPLRDIELELELDNNENISDYIESIEIVKAEGENTLYLDNLYIDDEDYEVNWKPQTGKEMLSALDSFEIKITLKENIPMNTEVDFDLTIRLINLFGDTEYLSGSEIVGNFSQIYFKKE